VSKNRKTPRFDVDYKQRLEQSRTASDAVRMPRLGYAQYRVYDVETKKDKVAPNSQYGQHIGRGIRPGPMNISYGSGPSRKSSHNVTRHYNNSNWQKLMWAFIDEIESFSQPAYDVRWLKPKHVTLLELKGYRVELAQPGDKGVKKNNSYAPVKLGA